MNYPKLVLGKRGLRTGRHDSVGQVTGGREGE